MERNAYCYAAGILDGEGTIGIYRCKKGKAVLDFKLCIHIANTSLKLMRWLVQNFGGNYYQNNGGYQKKNLTSKTLYVWVISGSKNRERFLLGIIPYLLLKKEQAKAALEFVRLSGTRCPEERQGLVERCYKANHQDENPQRPYVEHNVSKL